MCGGYGIFILGVILAIYMYNTSPKAVLLFTILYTCIYISLREIKFSFYFFFFCKCLFLFIISWSYSSLFVWSMADTVEGCFWLHRRRVNSLVSTFYNVCIAEIVDLVFMKLFFSFFVWGWGGYFPYSIDQSKIQIAFGMLYSQYQYIKKKTFKKFNKF